ncbi:MAG: hypothetical protein NTV23_15690 [Propionibacteriales bacterium]|nr:hypothetical protein [Propionibacteriales bacterium]
MNTLYAIATFVSLAVDPTPDKEDIKAGWGAFGIFIAMAVAVGLLGWSLTRHLKKTKQNAEAGVFGETPDEAAKDS